MRFKKIFELKNILHKVDTHVIKGIENKRMNERVR